MPLRCADCDHEMLLSPDGATASIACENCGGKRLYRSQPSPTHSDGDLRDMVDPGIGLDQGGNPNAEGIWAGNNMKWQNYNVRDESYASVRTAMDFDFESEPRTPSHHVIVDGLGNVYSGSFPEPHESIAERHRMDEHSFVNGSSKGAIFPEGDTEWYSHSSGHSPAALEQMLYGHFGAPYSVDPNLASQTEAERWGIQPGAIGGGRGEMEILQGPPNIRQRGMPLDRSEGLVRGGSLDTEAHDHHFGFHVAADELATEVPTQAAAPQYHQEGVLPGSHPNAEGGGRLGIHAGTTKWLGFLDAHVDGQPVRGNEQAIISQYSGQQNPVTVSAHHPDHLAAAIDVIEHSALGSRPSPKMIEVGRAIQRGQMEPPPGIGAHSFVKRTHISKSYGIQHLAFLPLLLGLGAGAELAGGAAAGEGMAGLAGIAAPSLMRGALMGAGSNLVQGLGGDNGPSQEPPLPETRDVGVLGKTADLETPHTNPGFHDDPDGDPHQFKDGDHSTNPENPNLNGEAGGSQLGEDNVPGGFGPNSPAMNDFNLVFPKILHYYHSDESGAHDPMIRQLHEKMDAEMPGYLDSVDDEQGAQAVQHLMDRLRDPGGVHAKIAVAPMYQTPLQPGQMMMGPQQQQVPQAGPPQPQQIGNCPYCGGTTLADGSCPQCGAKAGPPGVGSLPGGQQPGGVPTPVGTGVALNTPTPFVGHTSSGIDPDLWPGGAHPMERGDNGLPPVTRYMGIPEVLCPRCKGDDNDCPQCGGNAYIPMGNDGTANLVDRDHQIFDPNLHGVQGVQNYHGIRPQGSRLAADTQGPVSKEQQAAVAQLLIDTHRHDEIPIMLQQPELYADELAQVTQSDQTLPPPVDPSQTPPQPPAVDPSQMAQMPVPGMQVPPGAGGSPSPYMGRVATPHAGAPRCPNCGSATTGFVKNEIGEVSGDCHACGNVWDIPDASGTKTAAPYENPAAVSQPERQHAYDPEHDTDSSHTWTDEDGSPIVPGQEYELFTAQYPIPDRVRIDDVKPDEITYSTIGEFDPNPQDASGTLEYQNRISREEFQLEKYKFVKADDQHSDAGEQTLDQYADTSQAPQFTEPVQQPQISPRGSWTPEGRVAIHKHAPMSEYDKYFGGEAGAAEKAKAAMKKKYGDEEGEKIFYATVNKKKKSSSLDGSVSDDYCPRCASQHISSAMSSPVSTFHECYKCGHGWETKEEDFEGDGAQARSWIMSSDSRGDDDFWSGYERARKMGESETGSRSLAQAASRDPRLREISERLDSNKMAREAGKKFSPYEQRQFIDEQGVARNADMLDLSGTHYESHRYLGEKANGMNVPDEELFLGI